MIICLKKDVDELQKKRLLDFLQEQGALFSLNETDFGEVIVVVNGISEDVRQRISGFAFVSATIPLEHQFKLAEKKSSEKTVISVKNTEIGNGFCLMAGPCAVQSEKQISSIAEEIVPLGANVLRGGAFKPRTSPYSFGGLGKDGLDLLVKTGKDYGVPVVCELTSLKYIDLYSEVDIIQVGARNMQNFEMLKELGRSQKPVLLKRGFGNTVNELLLSAEYILSGGNSNVILCERGVRSFEPVYRGMMDVTALVYLKQKSHLPIIADPSHASGSRNLVPSLALACAAAGCDGIMTEVDPEPEKALSDAAQAIDIQTFGEIAKKSREIFSILNRE